VVEVLQNCVIFNNRIHAEITGKDVRDDHQIYLVHGKPMIFGKERSKGLILRNNRLEVVTLGQNGIREEDILVHDATNPDDTTHYMLVRMSLPFYPIATGVIRACECSESFENLLEEQVQKARETSNVKNMDDLLNSGSILEL
jgi:2-oxoglutarate ferredoxin oxidoreductase subunit beta